MTYKVSYPSNFSPTGTHFDQTLNVQMTQDELGQLNLNLYRSKNRLTANTTLEGKDLSFSDQQFILFAKPFKEGGNFTTLTSRDFFIDYFELKGDKRILDRNTLINITIK